MLPPTDPRQIACCTASTATSVPSLFAPALNFCTDPGPFPAVKNSSRRVNIIFTGTPNCFDNRHAHFPVIADPELRSKPAAHVLHDRRHLALLQSQRASTHPPES